MSVTKRKYLLQIITGTVIIGCIGAWGFFSAFPQYYFNGYPIIPLYFLLLGGMTIQMVEGGNKLSPRAMLQMYMLVRVIRMLVSFLLMLLYGLLVKEEVKEFMLTFVAYYILYLIYDSWFFYSFKVNKKKE